MKALTIGLATDTEIGTQLSYCETACLGKRYKAFFCLRYASSVVVPPRYSHRCSFFPWHNYHLCVTDVLVLTVTDVLVLTVTDVFVLYPLFSMLQQANNEGVSNLLF